MLTISESKASSLGRVNIGIIGCGAVAETCHLPAVKSLSDLKIKALGDINREQAESVAERFHLREASIYTECKQMLKESDVDAVWILTPPRFHAEMVMNSLSFGKHILCEKPLATTLEEVEAIEKTLYQQNKDSHFLVVMPAHSFIFTPCFSRAVQIVKDGAIGRIKSLVGCAVSNLYFYRAKTDFRTLAKGGVIEDQLPHLIYLSHDVLGPRLNVVSVKPRSRGRTAAQDVNVEAEMPGGASVELAAAWSGFLPTLRLDLTGESGRISMDLLRRPYNLDVIKDGEKDSIRMGRQIRQSFDVLKSHHPSYLNEHRHFIDLINGDAEPRITVESGLNLARTLDEVMAVFSRQPGMTSERFRVSLVRVEADVDDAVRRSVSLLGGLNISEDARVVVKPNVCFRKNTQNMIITDPRVLDAVLKMLKEKTRNILVVESDNSSGSADDRVKKSGVLEVIEGCGSEFLNLSKDEFEEHRVSDLIVKIPRTVLEADYLINIPKMKTCNIENAFISIAMKNMFGILADKRKMPFHKSLTDVLLHVNRILPEQMIIVDGIVAMEGLGPVWGKPVQLNLVVSGSNPVAVDAVCCNVMGINPYAVEVLWKAYKSGLGEISIDQIQVEGEEIEKVKRRFMHPVLLTKNIKSAVRTVLKTYLS